MIDLNWYYSLNHPLFTPPSWFFAPAWTALYTMIFISLVLFTIKRTEQSKILGFVLFFIQIILNLGWTPVFFSFHRIGIAFVIIILLDIVVYFNILVFYKISKKSAYFLIPYFLWILFATYLNLGMFILN